MGHKKKLASILILAAFVLSGALLQNAFAADNIAYVDLATVFDGYEKTKDYDVTLEQAQKEKQEEIDSKVESIKEMQDKLDLLNEEEKQSKQEEIYELTRDLQEFQRTAETDLTEQRNERLKEVLQDIQDVVEEIAKQKNYDYILNDRVLLYGKETLDISQDVLKQLNDNYKKKN